MQSLEALRRVDLNSERGHFSLITQLSIAVTFISMIFISGLINDRIDSLEDKIDALNATPTPTPEAGIGNSDDILDISPQVVFPE